MGRKRKISLKRVLIGVCAFGLCAAIFFFISQIQNKSIPHRNTIDTKISQYSDSHIAESAIAVNSQFKNIAFEAPPGKMSISSQFAAAIKAVKSLIKISEKGAAKEYGSWVWTPIMDMTPKYMESVISEAKANKVNVIYVSIDSYLDIFTMQKGTERDRLKNEFGKKLENFINLANRNSIAVDAEAGWRNWAEEGNEYKAFAVVNYVKNFNNAHKNKFRGFQYDVEPYLLDSYDKNKASVLKNFVALVDKTEYSLGTSTLRFSVVVPDFYDEKDKMTPKFSYNGEKNYAFKHLLNILDKRENSSIIVMSYRNYAYGNDGSIEVSSNEMQTADRGAYDTKIIIAQETGDVPPPYITFHNTSKKYLLREIGKIDASFSQYANFGGIAIHYANAFLALK